jgi:hypothetical protein
MTPGFNVIPRLLLHVDAAEWNHISLSQKALLRQYVARSGERFQDKMVHPGDFFPVFIGSFGKKLPEIHSRRYGDAVM